MSIFKDRINQKFQDLTQRGQLRSLKIPASTLEDFTSNDYLGLARSEALFNSITEKVVSLQPHYNGATGSRLLSGNTAYAEEVEALLATLFKSESTLIFNSGYAANQGVLSCLPQKGDTILYDELAHACIKDGARLSLANRFSFRHNDLNDLERKLQQSTGVKFIAIEAIYSMDGDECPLREVVTLARKYDAVVVLDEAHSTGILGKNGSGLAVSQGLENDIDLRIYTFGKAMGIHGACVACSERLKNYLINFSRPFIYTTALPLHSMVSIDCAFAYLKSNTSLQRVLQEKIDLFKTSFSGNTISNSAIQPVVVPGNAEVRKAASELVAHGFDIRPIVSPTVKEGTERLRICLHTYNTDEAILRLTEKLNLHVIHTSLNQPKYM